MYYLYLLALIAISAADDPEIVTAVNCALGTAVTETIHGKNNTKWQFFRSNCSPEVFLYINITKVQLCNKPGLTTKHAILVIERRPSATSGRPEHVLESKDFGPIPLRDYEQVDLYSTIDSRQRRQGCDFIVEFNYLFASPTVSTAASVYQTTQPIETTTHDEENISTVSPDQQSLPATSPTTNHHTEKVTVTESELGGTGSKEGDYRNSPIAIVGTFVGGVALTLLVVAAVFVWKRYLPRRIPKIKGKAQDVPTKSDGAGPNQDYENVDDQEVKKTITQEEYPGYEIPIAAKDQTVTLEENPGYEIPSATNALAITLEEHITGYETVNCNASHIYERPA